MSTLQTAHHLATTLNLDARKMRIRSVITALEPDRVGDVVVPMGLKNRDEVLMNPVVLWAHNRYQFPPIGVCEWLDVQPTRIVAQTRFAEDVALSEDVFRLYEQGILRGWSIGFAPRRTLKRPLPDGGVGLRFEEWDLIEYSAVPIPEHPDAITMAVEKGWVRDLAFREWWRQQSNQLPSQFPFQPKPSWGGPVADVLAGLWSASPSANAEGDLT
jgi:phage head maturation protease